MTTDERNNLKLFDYLPIGIFKTDGGGKIIYANESLAKLLGFSDLNELKSFQSDEYFNIISLQNLNEVDLKEKSVFSEELTIKKIDGEFIQVKACWLIVKDNDNNLCIEGSFEPIVSKDESVIKDETNLSETPVLDYVQLKQAVEQSVNSVIITDNKGIVTFINPSGEKSSGYLKEELLGENVAKLNSGYLDKSIFTDLWNTISSGNVWSGEFRNKNKSGKYYWEHASISPVFDAAGNIIRYISIKDDITERKELDIKIKANEAKMKALLNAIPDLIFMFDKYGVIIDTYVPEGNTIIFPPESIKNKSIYEVVGVENGDLTIQHINLAIETNLPQLYFYEIDINDFKKIYEARLVKCGENQALAIVRDITQAKKDEHRIIQQIKIKEILTKWAGEFINVSPEHTDENINSAIADIGKVLDIDRVYLFKYHFGKNYAENTHEWSNEGISSEMDNLKSVPFEVMPGWVNEHSNGNIVLVENVDLLPDDDPTRLILEEQGIKTVMSIPIISNGECLGFVGFDACKELKQWTEEEILVLKFLAELIANLLHRVENIRQKQIVEEALVQQTMIREILSKLAREFINIPESHYDKTINGALHDIGKVVDVDRVYLFKYDFENNLAYNTHEWVAEGIEPQIENFGVVPFEGMMQWVEYHTKGEPVLIQEVEDMDDSDPLKYVLVSQGTSSALSIPIYSETKSLGFIGFDAVQRKKIWTDDEVMLLKFLSDLIYNLQDRIHKQEELLLAKNKAEESDKLKSAFLANMSHEIRTPMNGIIGFSKLILNTDLTDKEKEDYTQIIKTSGSKLISLINNILDLAKIESGQMDVFNTHINVNSLFIELYNYYQLNVLEQSGKKLRLNLALAEPEKNIFIVSDQTKLHFIISSLIDNAIKFTQEGTIEFGYILKEDKIEIFVSDTGMGISEDFLPYLFERFRQEDVNISSSKEGSGLGLAITKGMTDLIGGSITVQTKKNIGTKFCVFLPLKDVTLKNITKKNTEHIMMMDWKESAILIVEDDEVNFKYVEKLLSRIKGITTVRAKNGKEAVDFAINNPDISLVLMDIKMPLMDGHAATKLIKEKRPDLPVIAVTAFAMIQDKSYAIDAGCDDYISKPFEADIILGIINKYLNATN